MVYRTRSTPRDRKPLRAQNDPGPARPIMFLFVGLLCLAFVAVGVAMVRHNFLGNESERYYSERVNTPWHFVSPLDSAR